MEHFFAPCPRGLEAALSRELEALGTDSLSPITGGVGFIAPYASCYRVNLESRLASRVLWRVLASPYRSETDVYNAIRALPWSSWFSPRCTIKVTVGARHCPLKSLDFLTLRIKDAVCDRFRTVTGRRPSVETSRPDIRIEVFLDERECLVYLDTSGEALFKRGLRRESVEAPLRENLAAGLLALSGWTPEQVLLDPMCGGGTILVEAAQIGSRIAPGLGRHFAFERFSNFNREAWTEICAAAQTRHTPNPSLVIHGSDRSGQAIESAAANLAAAGLTQGVTLKQADVLDLEPPCETGILIMNPPYGVRTGEQDALAQFYPRLGDMLKQRFPGWNAYIFTADVRLPKLIGLAPSRRTPLFNGALECRLFEFKLIRGPARRALRAKIAS